MRGTIEPQARHLDDGELMRYIDGEGEPAERERWMTHAGGCLRCAAEVRALREQTVSVTEWLARAAFEDGPAREPAVHAAAAAPRGRFTQRSSDTRSAWLRAAVIALLVAAPVAALPGARDWVADRLVGLWPSAGEPAATVETSSTPMALRFAPGPGAFTLVVDDGPAEGRLTVGRSERPDAAFRAVSAAPLRPVVSAASLRLVPASPGDYTLLLPDRVTGLVVRTAAGVRTLDAGAIDAGVTLDLAVIGRTSR